MKLRQSLLNLIKLNAKTQSYLNRFAPILLAPLALYAIYLFCHKQTAGFQITKVLSPLSPASQWETPPPEASVKEILKQPFYYLDKGGQSYAFLSQDGKTVLKLFKMHNLRQYSWGYKTALPVYWDQLRLHALYRQKAKLNRLFNSSSLAYNELKEETGLLYLNLNPNPAFKHLQVTIVDNLGISHSLSLESIPFALQKRVNLALKTLKACLKKQEIIRAKEILRQMITCLKERQEKGIIDIDPAFKRNMGLSDERAIFMDIGAFFPSNEPLGDEDLFKDTRHLKKWLNKHSIELANYLDELVIPKLPQKLANERD